MAQSHYPPILTASQSTMFSNGCSILCPILCRYRNPKGTSDAHRPKHATKLTANSSMPSTPGPLLTTQPKARATFDSLPLKVRKRIYAYDLSGALPKLSSVGKPALLGTCRDVDSEALQIPSGSHVSQTSIPSRVVRWLHSLASEERAGLEQVFISTRRLRIAALVDSVLGNGCGAPGRIAAVEQTLASVDCTLPSGVVHIPCYDGRIYTWTNIYGDVVLWQDGCRWMRSIRDGHSSVHEEGMGALTDVAGAGRS